MDIIKGLFIAIQLVSALALVGIVMSQSTKSEGLTGTIGGKAESAFRGKPGSEERLSEVTKWAAILFMVTSAAAGYLYSIH